MVLRIKAKNKNLPLPYVMYPGGGAFFTFRESRDSTDVLCSCSEIAVLSYLRFKIKDSPVMHIDPTREYILNSYDFPYEFIVNLMKNKVPDSPKVFNYISFEGDLCHECNEVTPEYSYCTPMYGSIFKQKHGWYINKQAYEWGVDPHSFRIIRDIAPPQILKHVEMDPHDTINTIDELRNRGLNRYNLWDEYSKITKAFNKQNRKVLKVIENKVRQKFNHKKVGEGWDSETMLYNMVKQLFPKYSIHFHYRPAFLKGLELDVYIDELRLGIEYQGIQHYQPIKHWGGTDSLKKTEERDRKKRELCKLNNVKLIEIRYDEELELEAVQRKISQRI